MRITSAFFVIDHLESGFPSLTGFTVTYHCHQAVSSTRTSENVKANFSSYVGCVGCVWLVVDSNVKRLVRSLALNDWYDASVIFVIPLHSFLHAPGC